jgi:rare lipoprotein A
MSSVSLRSFSRFSIGVTRIYIRLGDSGSPVGKALQWFGVALGAATLAACAQTSVTTGKFASSATTRQASSESHVKTSFVRRGSGAGLAREQVSRATREHANHVQETQGASNGLASSYGEGSQTASGERFDVNELTAAHRTLPFGTRVRVTNHSNGRSVVVTINDRGPFVSGRIIDVTPAAARAIGMSGLAPVTIERQ